jgi:hypothetical protein
MTHQTKHLRRSKKGKLFVAGARIPRYIEYQGYAMFRNYGGWLYSAPMGVDGKPVWSANEIVAHYHDQRTKLELEKIAARLGAKPEWYVPTAGGKLRPDDFASKNYFQPRPCKECGKITKSSNLQFTLWCNKCWNAAGRRNAAKLRAEQSGGKIKKKDELINMRGFNFFREKTGYVLEDYKGQPLYYYSRIMPRMKQVFHPYFGNYEAIDFEVLMGYVKGTRRFGVPPRKMYWDGDKEWESHRDQIYTFKSSFGRDSIGGKTKAKGTHEDEEAREENQRNQDEHDSMMDKFPKEGMQY